MVCNYSSMPRAWMSNYIPLFYMDLITYPFPNPETGWVTPVSKRGPKPQWKWIKEGHDLGSLKCYNFVLCTCCLLVNLSFVHFYIVACDVCYRSVETCVILLYLFVLWIFSVSFILWIFSVSCQPFCYTNTYIDGLLWRKNVQMTQLCNIIILKQLGIVTCKRILEPVHIHNKI